MNELLIDRLKTARNSKGLKQQDVADQLGIKANTISNWEKGRTEPDIDTFVKLCKIYQIDCPSLLSDVYAFDRISNDISLQEYDFIKKYRVLDKHGKEMVDLVLEKEYDRCISLQSKKISNFQDYELSAANDKGATPEQKKNADSIMMDDGEWE